MNSASNIAWRWDIDSAELFFIREENAYIVDFSGTQQPGFLVDAPVSLAQALRPVGVSQESLWGLLLAEEHCPDGKSVCLDDFCSPATGGLCTVGHQWLAYWASNSITLKHSNNVVSANVILAHYFRSVIYQFFYSCTCVFYLLDF